MIARLFYVIVYISVSVAAAVFFLDPQDNFASLKSQLRIHLHQVINAVSKVHGESSVPTPTRMGGISEDQSGGDEGLNRTDENGGAGNAGSKPAGSGPAEIGQADDEMVVDLGNSDIVPPKPKFDRIGLELLFAHAQDFETELEFVVPKPQRARRPRNPNLKLAQKPPIEFLKVPKPQLAPRPKPKLAERPKPARPLTRPPAYTPSYVTTTGRTKLVAFNNAPFPYTGNVARSQRPFLNVKKDGRRGHRTRTGRLYWADTTYSDQRSLLHVPKGFDAEKPGVMVVFFHGWGAKLERDIWRRQKLPEQISRSGTNAVLVAPQFGVNARDSSIGNFWRPGALREYLDEAAVKLANLSGKPDAVDAFLDMPIVLVGYSGGYVPTAWALAQGGIGKRVLGVVLLDALYGQLGTFSKWIKRSRHTFFVSAHMSSTRRGNERLRSVMTKAGIPYQSELNGQLQPGSVKIIHAPERHRDYVTQAWAANPVADILTRIPGLPQRGNVALTSSLQQPSWR